MNLMAQLTVAVKNITDIENHMISVERILEYDYIGQEGQESSRNMLPVTWPSSGEIRFEKVNVKYGKTDPNVLKDLTFSVEPLLKIGIVGRTGAGKSSLINALFQLVHTEGKILIDNINISTIGLHDLRKSISIIPQNPVVFSGTLRYNLDPANEYQDETLWKALEEVGLKTFVQNLRLGIVV
uniref:ABC transporter domain-containing protein n=1 Tax=Photinus pyralis TaxID=7054 RepID=A0A1Y1M1W4_PHOPY